MLPRPPRLREAEARDIASFWRPGKHDGVNCANADRAPGFLRCRTIVWKAKDGLRPEELTSLRASGAGN